MDSELPVELDPPDGVDDAAEAVELMRAWICDGALLVALNSSAFGDHVADWGRLLAEVGHHIAKAAALNGYMPEADAQATLRDAFVAGFGSFRRAPRGASRAARSTRHGDECRDPRAASPLARRLARQAGLALDALAGSGRTGASSSATSRRR